MKWGILGASNFAKKQMAPAIHLASGAELVALATSSAEKAAPFEALAPGLTVFDDYDALLADETIDAVYIPLPNHLHVSWALKALAAGKHVLCEKPFALKAEEFDAIHDAAKRAGKHCAEAYMITHHPQWHRAKALLSEGAIGNLKHVDTVFTYNNAADPKNIRHDPSMGGGGLRDIGVYTFGSVRYATGQEPQKITHARIDLEGGVDVFAQVSAEFESFTYNATVSMRMHPRQEVVFHGDKGLIRMTCPFNAGLFDQAELVLEQDGQERHIQRWPGVNQYVLQVETFAKVARGEIDDPCPLAFARGTQEMIEMVFAAGRAT